MESPLRRNRVPPSSALIDRGASDSTRLYPDFRCREARWSGRCMFAENECIMVYLERTNRTSQHDETGYI